MDIQFLFLKILKKENNQLYFRTIEWIKNLTIDLDHEDGNFFVKFVEKNIELPTPFQVFIAYDRSINDIVGIASLIPDDQNVGKKLKLKGIWLGGVNIKREYRNKGYGKKLITYIDEYLKNLKDKPIKVNLFSNNPIAIRLYEKVGFKYSGLEVQRGEKNNKIYSKDY
jgi:RimJ/RimL family protein N-acetyltransferase